MDLVTVEVVVLLPRAVGIQFQSAALVQVDERHALDGSDIGTPFRLWLAYGLARLLVVGIARRERHQDGVGPSLPNLLDVFAQIGAIAVDRVLLLCALVEAHVHRVGIDAGYDGASPFLVEELAIVVMADGHNHPVARLQCVAHGRPQVGVERTGGHAAQRLVLDCYSAFVEVLVGIVAPSPLSVGAVALGAVAHGGVAHEIQHGVVALAR